MCRRERVKKERTRSHKRGEVAYPGIGRYFHRSRSFREKPRGENQGELPKSSNHF